MGQEAKTRQARKQAVIHRRRLFDGKVTAEELHRALAFQGRCGECGGPPAIRARTFAPIEELHRRSPEFLIQLALRNEGRVPVIEFTYGKFVCIGDAYACDLCRGALERELAKAPSWVLVELDNGPGKDRPIVQVPERESHAG